MFKVLTINDDPAMTGQLTLLLKTYGLDAYMANSGEEGLQLIRMISPDVVILDLAIPSMDSWQIFSQIRSFGNIPILILSALDSPGMVTSALDSGADDYLVKPVPSRVLVAHLTMLARRAMTERNHTDRLTIHTAELST